MSDVLICTDWNAASSACGSIAIVQDVYLMPTSVEGYTELLLNGGFSPEAFSIAFVGTLLLWATGLGIGLIVSKIRSTRI